MNEFACSAHRRASRRRWTAVAAVSLLLKSVVAAPTPQVQIGRVELMPNEPSPYRLADWQKIAKDFDQLAFDFNATGEYLPLIWWDDTHVNIPGRGFGLPSYVGHPEMKGGNHHEALTVLGSLYGASVAGIDKSTPVNYVAMAEQYFNSANGENLVLNRVSAKTGETYWYELFPQVIFDSLSDRYPKDVRMAEIMRVSADKWNTAYKALSAQPGGMHLSHTAFDFAKMQPFDNGKWKEPDGAAAIAWIQYMAYQRFGDAKYLEAADGCVQALQKYPVNPSYEVLMPLGALAAARMNAELDRNLDVDQLLNWCFNPSETRSGWGVIVGKWGDYECSGLVGSTTDGGGYGFVMNTFANAASLVPLVRYDERYARAIGKWMLNASNSVRLCYPNELPRELQSCPDWKSSPANAIAYEGIRRQRNGKRPYASGDPIANKWGPTDLGLYGSSYVGIYAGIIHGTGDPQILQLDLLATDVFRSKAYPSFLLYNPHGKAASVTIDVGEQPCDVYDAVQNEFIAKRVSAKTSITIAPDSARVIILPPAGGQVTYDGPRTLVDGVVIDYNNDRVDRKSPPAREAKVDRARIVPVPKAVISINGDLEDWKSVKSERVRLTTSGRGQLECDVRFAWDEQYVYCLIEETHAGQDFHEAPDAKAYGAAPWDFDGVWLSFDLANNREASLGSLVLSMALNSTAQKNLFISPEVPDDGTAYIATASGGTAKDHNRFIEARLAWKGLVKATFGENQPQEGHLAQIKPGLRLGCDPLLVEFNHKRQSYIGGGQYTKPTGSDENSVDLLLQP